MVDITLKYINETHLRIESESGILREISDRFTFDVPNARFSPAFKKRHWDGKIRLFNTRTQRIYAGLAKNIRDYAFENDYNLIDDTGFTEETEFSLVEAMEFCKGLGLPFMPKDYQLHAFALAVRNNRTVLISPTSSGKSLIAYLITRYFNKKTLIVVPTISLVDQMKDEFKEYGYKDYIHGVMAGIEKSDKAQITVSTWQSIYELPESYFNQFDVIIGDEAHLFKAKSLTSVMEKLSKTRIRIGMSGTLDGSLVNALVLEGLFGPIHKVISIKELIERGDASNLKIRVLLLNHLQKYKSINRTYEEEIKYLIGSIARNNFIVNLALSLKGNTLILFSRVDQHGKILRDMLKEKNSERDIKYVSGEVTADQRNLIRAYMEAHDGVITVASFQTFSTGINIKRLNNIIFASPTKSKIRTFQSIGRGLRLDAKNNKTHVDLYDIGDDLNRGYKQNYVFKCLIERIKMYESEGFIYDTHKINLRG